MFGLPIKKPAKEEKPLTIREQREAEKKAETKKRINIFLSRISGEDGGGSATGFQTSKTTFAGGVVESRSRVSKVGSESGIRAGRFGKSSSPSYGRQVKTGFAQGGSRPSTGTSSMNKPPTRPLGFS